MSSLQMSRDFDACIDRPVRSDLGRSQTVTLGDCGS